MAAENRRILEISIDTYFCGRSFAPSVEQVICLNLTLYMLFAGKEQAEKQELGNMAFVIDDTGELLFLDNSFSIVISRLAFHHFPLM